jgi:hypothetical protein
MGYMTTLVILNDHLHSIRDDEKFGMKVYDAILKCGSRGEEIFWSGNGVQVIESHHADERVLLVVGGNCAQVLNHTYGFADWRKPDVQETILREFAEKLGFIVSKKRKSK